MATFNDLPPEVVVVHVAPYLSNVDLSSLAKTSGTLLRHLRRVRLYHLWQLYNRMYVEDAAFREEVKRWIPVDRLVLVGWDIMSLPDLAAFSGVHSALLVRPDSTCELPMDLASLRGVHTVHLTITNSETADMSHLSDVRELRLIGEAFSEFELDVPLFRRARSVAISGVTTNDLRYVVGVPHVRLNGCCQPDRQSHKDFSVLRHARTITLRGMNEVNLGALESAREVSISKCKDVIGLPPATHLRSFTWHFSPLTSIPPEFGGLHFLDLSFSDELEDVAAARHVHTLILRSCRIVRDVSALGSVHTFEFSNGIGTYDVSALGRVHTLRLNYFEALVGVASLDGVHSLNISSSRFPWTDDVYRALGSCHTLDLSHTDASDLSAFGRVHTLQLCAERREHIKGVAALANCHSLDFAESYVEDVSALGRVHTLILKRTRVTDVSALGSVHLLDLSECKVTDVSMLGGVHTLRLSSKNVKDVSALGRVHTLSIRHTDVSRLGAVYDLTINSKVLTDVSMLGGVHRLDLTGCTRVTDVSALGGVHTLILRSCPVTDVSHLERVCVLDVSHCPIIDRSPLERVRCVVGKDLLPLKLIE